MAQESWKPTVVPVAGGDVSDELQEIGRLVRDGQANEAAQRLHRILSERPDFAQGHMWLGSIMLARGNVDEAALSFRRALSIDPRLAKAQLGLGRVHEERQETEQARKLYESAAKADPELADARIRLASLLHAEERHGDAEAHLAAVLERNPQDLPARLLLASIYGETGRLAKGEGVLEEILQDQPNNVMALMRLAALRAKDKPEAAADLFERAAAADPENVIAWFTLGSHQLRLGRLDGAETAFKTVLRLNARMFPAAYKLADVYIESGRYLEAMELLRQVIRRAPGRHSAHQRLAEIYMRQQRWDFALREYRAAMLADEKLPLAEPRLLELVEDARPVEERVKEIQPLVRKVMEGDVPEDQWQERRSRRRAVMQRLMRARSRPRGEGA